jgi:D-alanyl-D-alanine carboxypeptidase/D-alanyl-D-alanine-endopeptidase (penicillin-binding protein 4)
MRRVLVAVLALVVAVLAYGTLDVFDVVPGILTRDTAPPSAPPTPAPTPGTTPTVTIPTVDPGAQPLEPAAASAPIPDPAVVHRRMAAAISDPALGPSPGVVVRDAFTGQLLLQRDPDRPRVAASTAKLLTALAVGTTLEPRATLPTTVVQGASPGEVVLVAGGDTMLAKGKGLPAVVEGRAGLGDLASQVAAALQAEARTSVTLRLDTTYAKGPRWAPGWSQADVYAGFTGGVSMLGLAGQRAHPGKPAPRDEGLARQAAVSTGSPATFAAAAAFVTKAVGAQGVDLTGVTLKDASGLSPGQAIPPRVLSDVLQLGADGSVAAMQDTVAELPVAGLTGTLHDRFTGRLTHLVAGVARAKTGTLTGSSAIAGTVIDADGRVLSYVAVADRIPAGVGTLAARSALDRFVATLATCGCG